MKDFSDEEIMRAAEHVPAPVKEAVYSPDTISSVVMLGKKHNLHVDVIGSVAELNRNMLLGLITPAELITELGKLGLENEQVTRIARELNEVIFKPLHQRMRDGAGQEAKREPAPPLAPVPAPLGRESVAPPPPAPPSYVPPPVVEAPMTAAPVAPLPTPEYAGPLPVYEPLPKREPIARPNISPDISGLPTPPPPKAYPRDPYREPIEDIKA